MCKGLNMYFRKGQESVMSSHMAPFKRRAFFMLHKFFNLPILLIPTSFVVLLSGCAFYQLREHPKTDLANRPEKTIILHYRNIQINLDKIQLTRTDVTGTVTQAFRSDEEPDENMHDREKALEAHVYLESLNCDTVRNGMSLTIPLGDVKTVKLYDANVKRMVVTYGGIAAGAAITIIVMATKQSCPFVYAYNGETYGFIGEIFSGAVYPQLERHDYLPLSLIKPVGGKYMLQITNEVKEVQHINFMELLAVDHPEGTRVLFDNNGIPFTLSNLQPARSCRASDGQEVSACTNTADSLFYTTNSRKPDLVMDSLVFTFNRQQGAQKAKLLVRAKNSFWLDYSYGRFLDLFGDKINTWNASRRTISRDNLIAWSRAQGLQLTVSVDEGNGWRTARSCDAVGPMALRDLVVPLTLTGAAGNSIRVKLEFGALFWEIDYAAVDYGTDLPVKVSTMPVVSALDQNGTDVLSSIKNDDTKYYDQPQTTDHATATFNAPAGDPHKTRTVFLHSKGYYDILRHAGGKPDLASLQMFRKPGGFVRFSNDCLNAAYGENKGTKRQ
jgi:hypothetical protein